MHFVETHNHANGNFLEIVIQAPNEIRTLFIIVSLIAIVCTLGAYFDAKVIKSGRVNQPNVIPIAIISTGTLIIAVIGYYILIITGVMHTYDGYYEIEDTITEIEPIEPTRYADDSNETHIALGDDVAIRVPDHIAEDFNVGDTIYVKTHEDAHGNPLNKIYFSNDIDTIKSIK